MEKMWVLANLAYLSILFCAVLLAVPPGLAAVLPMWDSAYVSGTVTSHAMGFPLAHGKRVVASGRLLSSRIRLTGSLFFNCWDLGSLDRSPYDAIQMTVTLLSGSASTAG